MVWRRSSEQAVLDALDQRIVLDGVSWSQYCALADSRGESAVPRMTYLEGTLELMSPSRSHEVTKTTLARLIESWAVANDVPLVGLGSLTMRKKKDRRGLEPDECYYVGPRRERPQLAIEVVYGSPLIDKLEVYRGLGVEEVCRRLSRPPSARPKRRRRAPKR